MSTVPILWLQALWVFTPPSGVKALPNMSLEKSRQFFKDDTEKFRALAKSIKLKAE